jgi:hypothetical protein
MGDAVVVMDMGLLHLRVRGFRHADRWDVRELLVPDHYVFDPANLDGHPLVRALGWEVAVREPCRIFGIGPADDEAVAVLEQLLLGLLIDGDLPTFDVAALVAYLQNLGLAMKNAR